MPTRHVTFSPLLPVQLTQVTTSDGVDLAGVVIEARGRKRAAMVWIHGLTSSFDRGQRLMGLMSAACRRQGIGYFKFNTRGHHLSSWGHKAGTFSGSSHERFRDCIKDIRAVIALARRRGYDRIILAGHSTGAQKALFYAVSTRDRRVRALLLAGPASDIAGELKHVTTRTLLSRVALATKQARHHPNDFVPASWGPWTYQRYVSLFTPGSVEETFPYHRLGGRWTYLRRNRLPLVMISGERDEYLDRPANELMSYFRSRAIGTKRFTGIVIPGAGHGFQQHEARFVAAVSRWVRRLDL